MKTNRIKASANPVHPLYFIQRDVDITLDAEAEDVTEFKTEENELDGIEIEHAIAEEIAEEIKDAIVAEMTYEVLERSEETVEQAEVSHLIIRKDLAAFEDIPCVNKKNSCQKKIADKVLEAITHRLRG